MTLRWSALAIGCAVLAACGERALQRDASGRYLSAGRVTLAALDAELGAAMRTTADTGLPPVLVVHDGPGAANALAAAADAGWRTVLIGDDGPRPHAPTARVAVDSGAGVAVELALLGCHGVAPPTRVGVGTRILTDGATIVQPAPGDFVVALLRRQHAELLAADAGTARCKLGFVPFAPGGRHELVAAEVETAAARWPQIELLRRDGDGTSDRQLALARVLLESGCRALLVTTDDPAGLEALAAAAAERRAASFLVDADAGSPHVTCSIGPDQETLGRAAAEAVSRLAPNGAAILEVAADFDGLAMQQRRRGFATVLDFAEKP